MKTQNPYIAFIREALPPVLLLMAALMLASCQQQSAQQQAAEHEMADADRPDKSRKPDKPGATNTQAAAADKGG